MTSESNKMIGEFTGKPLTQSFFTAIADYTHALGPVTTEVKGQASFAVKRKFLWCWAYEKTADGTLYLMVTLDQQLDDPNFHDVSHVSKNRWNHNVVVKSLETATSDWLRDLIRAGYEFAER